MIQWSEKELEDWLCSPAEEGGQWRLSDVLGGIIPQQGRPWKAVRQLPLGDMNADIVIAWVGYLAIIELKCKPATGDDLAQVLHYKAWLEQRLWNKHFDEQSSGRGPDVLTYLIASSFSERIRVAAHEAGIRLHGVQLAWVIGDGDHADHNWLYSNEIAEIPCDQFVDFAFGIEELSGPKSDTVTADVTEE